MKLFLKVMYRIITHKQKITFLRNEIIQGKSIDENNLLICNYLSPTTYWYTYKSSNINNTKIIKS